MECLSCCRTLAILRRRISVGPAPCVYSSLGAVYSRAMALGAPLLHVASKRLRSGVSLGCNVCLCDCCRTLAILRRRIGAGPAPCVYWGQGAVCILAVTPGATLLHVPSKSLRSGVSLGWNVYPWELLSDFSYPASTNRYRPSAVCVLGPG